MINEIMGIIAKNRRIKIGLSLALLLLVFVSIGFAALTVTLNISFGDIKQNALTWNVGFRGDVAHGVFSGTSNIGSTCGDATITPNTVTINGTSLSKPGDTCTYNLSIKNKGEVPAKLAGISAVEPSGTDCSIDGSTMVCGNLTYKLLAVDETSLTTGIIINNDENYNIKLVVSFTGETLSTTEVHQSGGKFVLTYNQAEIRTSGSGSSNLPVGVSTTKCKRATTLHTETCNRTSQGCYVDGYYESGSKGTTTITYGSLGTSGTLTSGDAFDCDVNGDGTYDPETERFYYVSGLDGNDTSEYVALIYFSNVSAGVINNKTTYDYANKNTYLSGPSTAYKQLPSTSQWSNVSLVNSGTRTIYDGNGNVLTSSFTYANKSARFISAKEINKACDIIVNESIKYTNGTLTKCLYLLQNTNYYTSSSVTSFYWTEIPFDANASWFVVGESKKLFANNIACGVRPVIEVNKTEIDY